MTTAPHRDRPESRLRALGRGVAGACPRCGSRGVFASLYELKERCPGCGLRFVREHGYWYGAMWVAMLAVVVVFATMLVVGIALTAPDVPWTGLLIAGLVVNAAIPLLGYGWAKTTWMGINLAIHQPEPAEEADAYTAREATLREPPASERYRPPQTGRGDPDESGEASSGL